MHFPVGRIAVDERTKDPVPLALPYTMDGYAQALEFASARLVHDHHRSACDPTCLRHGRKIELVIVRQLTKHLERRARLGWLGPHWIEIDDLGTAHVDAQG